MSSYRRFSVSGGGGSSNPYGGGGSSYGSGGTSYGGGRKYGGGPGIGGGTAYNPSSRYSSGTSYGGGTSYGTSRDVGSGYTSKRSSRSWSHLLSDKWSSEPSHVYRPLQDYKPSLPSLPSLPRPQYSRSPSASIETSPKRSNTYTSSITDFKLTRPQPERSWSHLLPEKRSTTSDSSPRSSIYRPLQDYKPSLPKLPRPQYSRSLSAPIQRVKTKASTITSDKAEPQQTRPQQRHSWSHLLPKEGSTTSDSSPRSSIYRPLQDYKPSLPKLPRPQYSRSLSAPLQRVETKVSTITSDKAEPQLPKSLQRRSWSHLLPEKRCSETTRSIYKPLQDYKPSLPSLPRPKYGRSLSAPPQSAAVPTSDFSSRGSASGSKTKSSGGGSGYGSLGRSYGYSSLPASDAGSTRSLASSRSYGSDRPSYGRQYSDSGGGGTSGHYSNFDSGSNYRSKPLDRSLSYASLNVGSVSNMKDRFDRPSSTRDRYSSVERLSSRDGDHGGRASGYMSDVGSSRSYGSYDRSSRAPSVSRSTYGSYSRETSPVRSSSRSSRYGGGGLDFGTSYSSRPKSSADTSTGYTRTRSSDLNLTPFSRTRTSSVSDRNYERQPSVDRSSRASVDRTISRASVDRHIPSVSSSSYNRQSSYTPSSKPPISAPSRRSQHVESEESSESVSESEEKRDTNYRYLVSRGTEPMDTEKERERESRRSYYSSRKEKKSISKTKTKRYPKKLYRRKRDKPQQIDTAVQVDPSNESDKMAARKERRDRLAGKYGGGGMSFGTTYSPKSPNNKSQSSFSPPSRQSSYPGPSSTSKDEPTSPTSPSRHSSQNEEDTSNRRLQRSFSSSQKDSEPTSQSSFKPIGRRPTVIGSTSPNVEEPPASKPKQSSFNPRMNAWSRRTTEAEDSSEEDDDDDDDDDSQVVSLTPENLSLKDSIDKVKSWKRQLSKNPPDTPTSPEPPQVQKKIPQPVRTAKVSQVKKMFSGGNKKKVSSSSSSSSSSSDSDEEVKKDYRKSELNKAGQLKQNNLKVIQQPKFGRSKKMPLSPRKLCAGVPNFPMNDDSDSDEPFKLNVKGQKQAVLKSRCEKNERAQQKHYEKAAAERSPSPYDNVRNKSGQQLKVKNQSNRAERSPSPYDNLTRSKGPKVVSKSKDSKISKAKSTDSLATNGSLPDLVPEGKRGHVFISKVQDIDSLLGFTDDDDEFISDSDEEVQQKNKKNQAKNKVDMINKNMLSPRPSPKQTAQNKPPTKQNTPRSTISMTPKKSAANNKLSFKNAMSKSKDGYIGRWRDVDELLGGETEDNRVRVLGAGGCAGGGGGQKLTLHIPQQQQTQPDMTPLLVGSSESLLDTPVPDTPDLPLAPLPAFAYNSPPSSAVSMDNLNSGFGFTSPTALAKQKERALKAQSMVNLDGDKSPANDNVPIGNLIDIRNSPEPTLRPGAPRNYPPNYSSVAIEEARTMIKKKGKCTLKDLLLICKRSRYVKPPWVEDEEDRSFAGYKTIVDMLEDMSIDTKKVCLEKMEGEELANA